MKRRMNVGAEPVKDPANGKFDPSTWAGQARLLARNEADATALLWGLVLFGMAAAVSLLALLAGLPARRLLSVEMLAVLGLVVLAVGVIWVYSYARALSADTEHVREATWRLELAQGLDLDGDGEVGPPRPAEPVGHVVKISGPKPAEIVLPDLDPPRGQRPLARFPDQPPVTPNDVIYILQRAAAEGVTFRAWERQRLPSGVQIDRTLWVGVIDGLLAWEFAVASTDGAGRRRVELRQDVDVETMIHAIQTGLQAAG